jgi:hypothetical protein
MMLDRNAFTREVARIVPNSHEGELLLLAVTADAKRVEAQRHWSPLERPVSLRDQLAERGGRVGWIISSLIPPESCNQRAIQVWQNHASDELCSIFRDGRSCTPKTTV